MSNSLQPHGLYGPWNSPGQNTGVGSLSLHRGSSQPRDQTQVSLCGGFCFERTASKHVYYLGWNRSPAQAGCMRQVLGPGALGRPRGIGWRGRWEGGSGWGIHVNPWLIHVNVWQKPLQYCKVISLRLIKINGKKKLKAWESASHPWRKCDCWPDCGSWMNLYVFRHYRFLSVWASSEHFTFW